MSIIGKDEVFLPGLLLFFCTAMTDYMVSPCPVGHFCPEATDAPITCPPGTYRDTQKAGGRINSQRLA